jgi:hypothetical protein
MKCLTMLAAGAVAASAGSVQAGPGWGTGVSINISTGFRFGGGHFRGSFCEPVRSCPPPVCVVPSRPIVYRRWCEPVYVRPCPPVVYTEPCVQVVRPVYVVPQPVYVTDYYPTQVQTFVNAPTPVVTVPIRHVSEEEWAWRALAKGDVDAMERFGKLAAASDATATADAGYAVCAAAAGQIDRADWAAAQALARDPDVARKLPDLPGLRDRIGAALRNYESLPQEKTAVRAQTVSFLKALAGDAEGAARAQAAADKLTATRLAKAAAPAPVELAMSGAK